MSAAPIAPIRTEADYEAALKEIEQVMDAEPDTPEGDRLDVLVTLVQAYEAKHHPIEAPDPVALIEHMMEARGLSRADLQPVFGRSGRTSEVLNRKRPLSLSMIRALHDKYGLPADVLIRDYPLTGANAG